MIIHGEFDNGHDNGPKILDTGLGPIIWSIIQSLYVILFNANYQITHILINEGMCVTAG